MKRFIDVHIPVTNCNLKCHYCYVAIGHERDSKATKFQYSAERIGMALTKERLGGICHFNLCGLGETLIPNEVVDIVKAILAEGHYIMIVTNGTLSKRFDEFCKFPEEYRKRLGFKFSYHYLELKRLKLFDCFYENVKKVHENGMSYSIELTPSDELEPYIEDIKKECMIHFGALCHITVPRDVSKPGYVLQSKHTMEQFKKIWGVFDSQLFDFKTQIWGVRRKEYCYAGAWSGLLNIGNGEFTACYGSRIRQNIFQDINKPIDFTAVGTTCRLDHCYNGHSFLALGTIPEIKSMRYNMERDRIDIRDGSHWLTPEMNAFLNQRLEDYNREFTKYDKFVNLMKICGYTTKCGITKIQNKLG